MLNDTLESLLLKISVQSIKNLITDTQDPITAQKRIEQLAFMRPILGIAQLMEINTHQNKCFYSIKFGFAPCFLFDTRYQDKIMHLDQLYWLMKIPSYEYNDEPNYFDKEGLAEWLSRSQIEICSSDFSRHAPVAAKLRNSITKFERYQ